MMDLDGRPDAAHLVRGSVHLVLAVAINGAGGFVFWWVAAWRESSADVGAAQGLFTSLMVLTCLTSMGLPIAVARFSADRSVAATNIFRWSLVYTALSAFVGATALVWLGPDELFSPIAGMGRVGAAVALGAVTAGMSFAILVEVRLMALRRWGWVVGRVLLVVGLRLPLLWVGAASPSRWMFVLVAGAPALSGVVGAVVLHRAGPAARGWWRHLPPDSGACLRYSAVHWVGLVGAQGPMFLIPFVVAVTVDSSTYAPFYIAWAVTQTAFVIPHMLGQTFLVETAKNALDEGRQSLVTLVLAVGTMAIVAAGSFVVGPVLGWTLGDEYRTAGHLLPWLLAGCVPWAVTSTVLARARFRHDAATIAQVTTAFFTCTLGAVALMVADGDPVGAARGWLVGNVAAAAVGASLVVAQRRRDATWDLPLESVPTTVDLEPVGP